MLTESRGDLGLFATKYLKSRKGYVDSREGRPGVSSIAGGDAAKQINNAGPVCGYSLVGG